MILKQTIKTIVELNAAGASASSIGKRFNISESFVKEVLLTQSKKVDSHLGAVEK